MLAYRALFRARVRAFSSSLFFFLSLFLSFLFSHFVSLLAYIPAPASPRRLSPPEITVGALARAHRAAVFCPCAVADIPIFMFQIPSVSQRVPDRETAQLAEAPGGQENNSSIGDFYGFSRARLVEKSFAWSANSRTPLFS